VEYLYEILYKTSRYACDHEMQNKICSPITLLCRVSCRTTWSTRTLPTPGSSASAWPTRWPPSMAGTYAVVIDLTTPEIRIRNFLGRPQCCGSGMFILDPNFFHPGSASKNFNPKNCFQALANMIRVVHPGSGSWFLHIRIQRSKRHRIPDPVDRFRNVRLVISGSDLSDIA
jgi:hypothetical protein